jgi:hypothetical protein
MMIQTSVSWSECADIVTFTGFWPKFYLEMNVKVNYLHVLTIHEKYKVYCHYNYIFKVTDIFFCSTLALRMVLEKSIFKYLAIFPGFFSTYSENIQNFRTIRTNF